MKKKLVALVIACTMIVSVFAGCGKSEDTGKADVTTKAEDGTTVSKSANELVDDENENLDITIWLYKDDYKVYDSYSENPVVDYLNKKYNCKLDFQQPAMGSEREQFSLMLGTGSYTDVMEVTFSTEGVASLYEDGIIIDLAPYIEKYAPNYYAFLQAPENEDVRKALYDNEGRIFSIPTGLRKDEAYHWGGLVYRRDILETMTGGYVSFPSGNEEMTTVEDWEYALSLMDLYFQAAGMTDYADLIIPYNGYFQTGELLNGFDAAPGIYVDGDIVKFGPAQDNFRNYLEKMHEWYEKGYIYKDFASRTNDMFYLPNTALTYGAAAGIWYGLTSQLGGAMSMPEYGLEMTVNAIPSPLDTAHTDKGMGFLSSDADRASANTNAYVVTKTCSEAKLARFLKICDFLFTDEGMMLRSYGLTTEQGAADNKVYVDAGLADGAYTGIEDTFKFNDLLVPDVGQLSIDGKANSFYGIRLPGLSLYKYNNAYTGEATKKASEEWRKFGKANTYPSGISLTAEDNDAVSSDYSNYSDYMDTMIPKFIMGYEEINDTTWANFVERVNSLGAENSVKIYQRYYDEYLAR